MTEYNGSGNGSKKKVKKLVWLKNRHRKLDEEINSYQEKTYLTSNDKLIILEMKKQKLNCKDEMQKLAASG